MTAPNSRERILPRLIEEEMQQSFINYSMSVIVSRALPDARDGLKPVHRRILYAMNELGLVPGRPYKKSATVVGDVLGKYHPHGDSSVYDALVRMVQEFSLRYPLIDGQGNFGSVDGDPAAAYRYTEARLTRVAVAMLEDIDKNTVDFQSNFDDRLQEPTVLPSKIPNLLVNGSSGIAVGMATNIPPHNLREVAKAVEMLVDNPEASIADLRKAIKGPDFPTGAFIYGREGIKEAYETGRGRVIMRARAQIEEKESSGRSQIVVTEIPYQVNKENLVKAIAELAMEKKIEGISGVNDESDKDGMRMVIDLKRDAIPNVVLNQLYKHTAMQSTFGVIMLALDKGAPKVMNLKQLLERYIDHRHEIIVRRTQFDLDAAQAREHILEGLKIAVDNIDEVIKIIRGSEDTPEADARLRKRFGLSEKQSDAILNMRLAKLTGLEIEKLEAELKEVRAVIKELKSILASKPKRMGILKSEMAEVVESFGDERRTEIVADQGEFTVEDLIAEEDMVITISHTGYIKRIPVSTYKRQRRGGRGLNGADLKENDWVEHLFIASTHDYLLFFTNTGQLYWLKVHEIPQAGRAARGKPVVNCIAIKPDRAGRGAGAGAGVHRRPVSHLRHPAGHGEEDAALRLWQRAHQRHLRDQHREGRRADRRAGLRLEQRHRPGDQGRDEHPLPPGGRPGDGPGHDRGEGRRAGEGRRGDRHGGRPARRDAPGREREGLRQALRAVRLPGPEARREGDHHPQEDGQDRLHRRAQGGHPRRRADDDHPPRRDHPAAGGRHPGHRPQHPGREGDEPRSGRHGGGRCAGGEGG